MNAELSVRFMTSDEAKEISDRIFEKKKELFQKLAGIGERNDMNEVLKSLIEANPDNVRSYPLKSFKLMGQTVSIGIIRDRAPERCQDDVKVFVNKELYASLHFPLND